MGHPNPEHPQAGRIPGPHSPFFLRKEKRRFAETKNALEGKRAEIKNSLTSFSPDPSTPKIPGGNL